MHAFAQRVARALPPSDNIVFGDSEAFPDFLIKSGRYLNLPKTTNASYAHEMLSQALDNSFDVIVPLTQDEIKQLAVCRDLFEEYGIHVAVPSITILDEIDFIVNPTKEFLPSVFLNGNSISEPASEAISANYSGVCLVSDSGEEVLFCCVG